MKSLLALLAACICTAAVQGQTPEGTQAADPGPELTLQGLGEPHISSVPGHLIMGPLKCDLEGKVYVRLFDVDSPFQAPIQQVDAHYQPGAAFRITAANPDFQGGDYSVTEDGDVYQLAWVAGGTEIFVVSYGRDGAVRSKTKLDTYFHPAGIVAFASGSFLVTGLEITKADGRLHLTHAPFTAIFDASGRLVKRVRFEEDESIQRSADLGDSNFLPQSGGDENVAVEFGSVLAGTDGNVYVMRRTTPALVYALSPTGEAVRKFEVDPEEPQALPVTMQAAAGRMAILFHRRGATDSVIKVFDLEGNPLAGYRVPQSLADAMTCYTPPQFTFLGIKGQRLAFYMAEPR